MAEDFPLLDAFLRARAAHDLTHEQVVAKSAE
jgi:hypothetical protein